MQQLTLFSNPSSTSRRSADKRLTKNARLQHRNRGQRDLWAPETEVEKEMALFFLDIRNFTPLVEKYQASDVIHIIKKLFSTFQNIIRVHHGRIIETFGDGFYAAFGMERNVEEAVNAAVKAGRAILETLDNLNVQTFEKNLQHRIEVGIGVHVGKVATGNFRIGSKDHFVVMGYPVNVASRLQSVTKELNNSFIVSSDVFKLLNTLDADSAPVNVNLKGVTGPSEVHLLGKCYGL